MLVPVGGLGVVAAAGGVGGVAAAGGAREGTEGARGARRGPGGHPGLVVSMQAGVSRTTRRHAFSSQTCVSGFGQPPARDGPAPKSGLEITRLRPAISTKYVGGLGWPGAGPQGWRSAARWVVWVPVALPPCTARRLSSMFLWPCIDLDIGARRVGGLHFGRHKTPQVRGSGSQKQGPRDRPKAGMLPSCSLGRHVVGHMSGVCVIRHTKELL